MSAILEVFYRKIPSIIFEPVAICGLLGLILAVIFFRKDWKNRYYLWIIFSLLLMLSWRSIIQIVSSRYGLFLMIPFSIAAGYFFSKLEFLNLYFKKIPLKYLKYLPYLCAGMIVVAGIAKTLAKDPYQAYKKTGLETRQDIEKNKEEKLFTAAIGVCNQAARPGQHSYYSSLRTYCHPALIPKAGKINLSKVKNIIQRECHRKNSKYDAVYFFLIQERKAPVITSSHVQLPENSFILVSSEYRNRKKKNILRVYRYIPPKGTFRRPLPKMKK